MKQWDRSPHQVEMTPHQQRNARRLLEECGLTRAMLLRIPRAGAQPQRKSSLFRRPSEYSKLSVR